MDLYLYRKNQPSTSASKMKHIESKETQCGSVQTNENESDSNDQLVTNLSILDGEFFKLISKENSKIVAQCITCNKKICGSTTSTGNFRSHIVRKHNSLLKVIENKKCLKRHGGQKENIEPKCKQTKLSTSQFCTKKHVTNLILEYIISEMRPISTVEKPSFVNLIRGITGEKIEIPSRPTIIKELIARYDVQQKYCKELFKSLSYICTTTDIWSCANKSYLGMTVHYIDEVTFERKSLIIACRRIKFRHTYDNIARCIDSIHKDCGIDVGKVTHTVTDNASNFCKAYKLFSVTNTFDKNQITVDTADAFDTGNSSINLEMEDADAMQHEDADGGTVQFVDINSILLSYQSDSDNLLQVLPDDVEIDFNENIDDIILPPHITCCAHSLNLIATKDAEAGLDSLAYKKIYRSCLSKIQAFWNLLRRSTLASDIVYETCKCKFPIPVITRWNSTFHSLRKLLPLKEKLITVFDQLKLPNLKIQEWNFIEEFCTVYEPLAISLDNLQGEKYCFLGCVAPTLSILRCKLQSLSHLTYCEPLKRALIEGLDKRFSYIFNLTKDHSKWFILSAISHPKFKLSWIPEKYFQICKTLFVNECLLIKRNGDHHDSESSSTSPSTSKDENDDFYNFQCSQPQDPLAINHTSIKNLSHENIVNCEILAYLENKKRDTSIFNQNYPTVKSMFIKYNTTIPSSAPVERAFSSGSQILSPRRNSLGDKTFEMLLILRNSLKNVEVKC